MRREVSLAQTLEDLFPPGVLGEESRDELSLLAACAVEFEKILQAMVVMTSKQNFEALGVTANDLRRRGAEVTCEGRSFRVSNTLDHLRSIVPGTTIEAGLNELSVKGIPNRRKRMRCMARAGASLAVFIRKEGFISAFEQVRHAHVGIKYEESNAQN